MEKFLLNTDQSQLSIKENNESSDEKRKIAHIKKKRLFCDAWLVEKAFKGWLQKIKDVDGTSIGFCKLCNISLKCKSGKSDLMTHINTGNHKKNEHQIKETKSIVEYLKDSTPGQCSVKKSRNETMCFHCGTRPFNSY